MWICVSCPWTNDPNLIRNGAKSTQILELEVSYQASRPPSWKEGFWQLPSRMRHCGRGPCHHWSLVCSLSLSPDHDNEQIDNHCFNDWWVFWYLVIKQWRSMEIGFDTSCANMLNFLGMCLCRYFGDLKSLSQMVHTTLSFVQQVA